MSTLSDLVLTALAAGRLSRLITEDEITEPLRDWMQGQSPRLAYLSSCTSCMSVYGAVAAVMMPRKLRAALAASELVILAKTIERSNVVSGPLLGVLDPRQDTA